MLEGVLTADESSPQNGFLVKMPIGLLLIAVCIAKLANVAYRNDVLRLAGS